MTTRTAVHGAGMLGGIRRMRRAVGRDLLGRHLTFRYHEVVVPFAVLVRLLMAWMFLYAGFHKLIEGFTAQGYLLKATSGPLHGTWVALGHSDLAVSVLNPLVVWGEILIGFALLFGVATRFALFWGGVMLFTFYISQFPPKTDLFLEYRLMYVVVLAMLGAIGVGRILGLDALIERWSVVKKHRWLRYLLG